MIASTLSAPAECVPATVFAVVLFRRGQFYKVDQFTFSSEAAEAYARATNESRVNREITGLSAKLIEVPLIAEQVAAVEAAIEQAIEGELSRAFRQ